MSKKAKIIIAISSALAVIFIALFCVAYFVLQIPLLDRSGWSTINGGSICYRDFYARPITGWQKIDGKTYCFADDGSMHTGWLSEGEKRYYFLPDGTMHTGALELEGERYLLDGDGVLQTGWVDGAYYGEDGALHTGWLELPEGKYLLDENGKPCTGWVTDNGKRYYLQSNGLLDTRWQDNETGLQYIVDGQPHVGWLDVPEGKFYFTEQGVSHTGWVTDERGRFYLYGDGTFATGFVTIGGVERYFLPTGEYIILCNRWKYIPDDYEMNLVSIGDYKLDASCYAAMLEMIEAAKADGLTLKFTSAYRSKKTQETLWKTRREKYMGQGMTREEADAKVGKSVAVPGTSEHQTGLAVDIGSGQKVYDWLAENSWKYGFILRYPEEKIDITGITYEPWHFRYVGKTMAKDVYDSGLCLEEYLEALKSK